MSDIAYQLLPVTTYPPCAVFDEPDYERGFELAHQQYQQDGTFTPTDLSKLISSQGLAGEARRGAETAREHYQRFFSVPSEPHNPVTNLVEDGDERRLWSWAFLEGRTAAQAKQSKNTNPYAYPVRGYNLFVTQMRFNAWEAGYNSIALKILGQVAVNRASAKAPPAPDTSLSPTTLEGCQAFMHARVLDPLPENPYPPGTSNHIEWQDGLSRAEAWFAELWAGRESYLPRYAGTEHRVLSKRLLLTGFRR